MKRILLIIIVTAAIIAIITGCDEPVTPVQYIVHYDSNPSTFSGNSNINFEGLVYFNQTKLSPYVGGYLTGIRVYNSQTSTVSFNIRVYGTGTASIPGASLFTQDNSLTASAWHDITLASPVSITSGLELWAGYYVDLTGIFPISLDGATRVDGVNFLSFNGGPYSVDMFSSNFNIRLIIEK